MNSDDTVIYRDVHTLILSTITIDYGRHDENIWSRYSTIIFMCVKRRKKTSLKKVLMLDCLTPLRTPCIVLTKKCK